MARCCCSPACRLLTAALLNELLRPLTGLSGFGSPNSSIRSQLMSSELVFHVAPFTGLSPPRHTRPGLQGRSGSIEEEVVETEGIFGSAEC